MKRVVWIEVAKLNARLDELSKAVAPDTAALEADQ